MAAKCSIVGEKKYGYEQMTEKDLVSHWIGQVKEGDSLAAHRLWQHYYERLVRAARLRLKGAHRGMGDEEDVVVSVFESFYRAAQDGRFPDLSSRDDMWRLLLRMSARKVIDRRRHELRKRRGGEQTLVSLNAPNANVDDRQLIEVIGNEPTPEMVAMMTESFEKLIQHLGVGQLREIAVGRMEGYSNAELAERMKCSERTIERRLCLIREKCQQELLDHDQPK